MKRLLLPAALLLSSAAWADIPPPDTSGCAGKEANASCQTDDSKAGACQTSKCSRLDYSSGTPPKSVTYDCLKCAASGAPPATTPPETTAPASNNEPKPRSGCTAAPGAPLALAALVAGWLTRHKRRRA